RIPKKKKSGPVPIWGCALSRLSFRACRTMSWYGWILSASKIFASAPAPKAWMAAPASVPISLSEEYMSNEKPGRGRVYDCITETIGDTPLVRMKRMPQEAGVHADILLKLEFFNPLASVKDRIGV